MAVRITDAIVYPSRATAADAIDGLQKHFGSVPDGAIPFLNALFFYANRKSLDGAILASHAANECNLFRDDRFRQRKDAFGIGVTATGVPGASFATYDDAAFYAVAEYCQKLRIPLAAAEAERAQAINPVKFARVAALVASVSFPVVTTLGDLNTRFGPNRREAVWMVDKNGPTAIVAKSRVLFPLVPDQSDPIIPAQETPPMATKPYVLLVAGHRSYNDGGNPAEKALTDDLARLYTAAFRAAGYRADWWQRDIDKDGDPDDTVGGLDTVAVGSANHLATIAGPKVLLDLHFNGANSRVHAIVPDSRGLTTAYANGSPADDAYANNTLDRTFAATWAQGVASAFGLPLFRGRASEPGVMLESETGVGLQGFRLATMAASAKVRVDTIRSVLEHAGYADWGSNPEAAFQRCAAIAVAAVGNVYDVTTAEAPPTPTKPTYAPRITTGLTGKDTTIKRDVTVKTGEKDADGKEITETVEAVYDVFVLVRPFTVTARTNRRQGPNSRGPKVGPALVVREVFEGAYYAAPRKQVGKNIPSSQYVLTEAGTWVLASALTPRVAIRRA